MYRFSKAHRLPGAQAYARVFAEAKRSRDACFTVLCRNNKKDVARLGLAIAKKHCRLATGRNRIKRLVRESFRQNQATLAGLDIVVISQPKSAKARNAQLFDSLAGHWARCSGALRPADREAK